MLPAARSSGSSSPPPPLWGWWTSVSSCSPSLFTHVLSLCLAPVHVLDHEAAAQPSHSQRLQRQIRRPAGFWNHQWTCECLHVTQPEHFMLTVELNILYVVWGRSKSIRAPMCNIWTLIISRLPVVLFICLPSFYLLYTCTHRYSCLTPSSSLQCKALWFMLDTPWIWPGDTLQEYNNLSHQTHSKAANQIKCVHQGFKLRNKIGFIIFNVVLSLTDQQE